ncbi:dUTP diphosphatase [[Mycoplasma] gypis]|uniref:dUTP diphosphatase n=1 Tax=[Mycoplasma] gypis TaxID=92404 RepID=A0ABZ2RQB3_9BACT|nr:dUTP diphosphatase [[Mycoplasma] gypis]MBN0919308.1 dUTP diphosphatase [[Mycoplasma] gypis]
MNLDKVFEIQKKLDAKFAENIDPNESNLQTKKIIALIVEISEFANEVQEFKYWKMNKNIDKAKVLEEYADGIHFLSSLSIGFGLCGEEFNPKVVANTFSKQLAVVFEKAGQLFSSDSKALLKEVFELYLGLAKILDINEEVIIESFFRKNEINFQRIKNNY